MKYTWNLILADTESDADGITAVPVGQEQEVATSTVAADPNAGPIRKQVPKSPVMQFLPLIAIFVLMYFLLFRGPKKKQQKHKQMVQSLEKNDRVRTIGGIVGTVVDVAGDEVTLKIDESNNTKIKIISSAIGRNMTKEKN